jgi:hypothetical protein
VNGRPLKNFGARCAFQAALQDANRINPNRRLLLSTPGMEVRRQMVFVVHHDLDAIENGYQWHRPII